MAVPNVQLYYDNADSAVAVAPVSFTGLDSGTPADPASVTCVMTSPAGVATSYVYTEGNSGLNQVVRVSPGNYQLTVDGLTVAGLYVYTWIGSGDGVQQVIPGTFRVVPLSAVGAGMQWWYTGRDELKHRLGIDNNKNDLEIALAIQASTNFINDYCGRHFYQLQETRTFVPASVWECPIDDLVSTPSVASATQVNLDYDGDGIYDVSWTQGVQYQLKLGGLGNSDDNYNINAGAIPRPYRNIQVLTGIPGASSAPGGGWFPWLWPYTFLNRVQVAGTWGWNAVPPAVQHASMLLTVDLYKAKDAAWGVAGMSDLGVVRVQSNPMIVELLRGYINFKRKAGV